MRTRLDAVLFVHAAGVEADLSARRAVFERVRAWTRSRRLLAALTVAAVGLAGAGLLVVASRDALPGDSIYGVKRVSEQAELAFKDPGPEQAETLLAFASNRIDEIDDLLKNPRATGSGPAASGTEAAPVSTLVNEALASMDTDAQRASKILTSSALTAKDPKPLQKIKAWADDRATKLTAVQPRLPLGSTDAAANSLTLLKQIGNRASALLGQLGCDCLDSGSTDGLGPKPSPAVPVVPDSSTAVGPSSAPPGPAAPSTSPSAGTTAPAAPAGPSSNAQPPASSAAPAPPSPVPLPEPTTEPTPPSAEPPPATGGTGGGSTGTAGTATVDQCIVTPLLSVCVPAG